MAFGMTIFGFFTLIQARMLYYYYPAAALAAQATRAARRALAADVLENSGNYAQLLPQVRALHARYLELARAATSGP